MTEPTGGSLAENGLDEMNRVKSSRGERITGMVVVAAVAAFFLFCVIESLAAGVGSLGQPRSGFWPLVVASTGLGV